MSAWMQAKDVELDQYVVGPEGVVYRVAGIQDLGDKIEMSLVEVGGDVELLFAPGAFEEVEIA